MNRKGREKKLNNWVSCNEEVEQKSRSIGFHEQRRKRKKV